MLLPITPFLNQPLTRRQDFSRNLFILTWTNARARNQVPQRKPRKCGKCQNGKRWKGSPWPRTTVTETALAAIRVKDCRLTAHYRRVMRNRGHKKAVVAVAHTILVIDYHMLKHQVPYEEVGAAYLDQQDREETTRWYVQHLESLGHPVTLEPTAS